MQMRLSGRDLKDFYYILGVDAERYAKQCWGPRVPASWFQFLDDPTLDDNGTYEEWCADDLESISSGAVDTRSPSHFAQPMAMALVMGDLNAVVAAQEAHLGLLDSGGIGANAGDIGRNRFFPRGRGLNHFRWGGPLEEEILFDVYIDDLCAVALVPWSQVGNAVSGGARLVAQADALYASENWPRSVAKDANDVTDGKMWGYTLEGNRGVVSISREVRMQLSLLTLRSLHLRWKGRDYASLIGLWSHVCQSRRCGYSIMASLYRVFKPHELEIKN